MYLKLFSRVHSRSLKLCLFAFMFSNTIQIVYGTLCWNAFVSSIREVIRTVVVDRVCPVKQ